MNKIIISIVTWNRINELQKTFDSILKFTSKPYKILITDNGSTDGTFEYLKDLEKSSIIDIEVFYLRENIGLPKARNIHWYKCKGYDVFSTYDDVEILTEGWLTKLKKISDDNNALVGLYDPIFIPDKDYNIDREPIPYREVNGACFIPKECVNKVGYWCEDYGLAGYDDIDYSCRAILSGFKTVYTRQVKWNHLCPFHHYGDLENAKKWSENLHKYNTGEKSL